MLLATVAALHGAPPAKLEITADRQELSETETILSGHAVLRDVDLLLTADEIRYNQKEDVATASGHVVATRGVLRLLADRVVLHRQKQSFTAEHIRVGSYPYYISGDSASGSRDEVTVHHARITYGEPGPWQPTAMAEEITLSSTGRRIRTNAAQVGIGDLQPLPFPKFQQSLSDPLLGFVTMTGGYRGSLGAYIDGGLHLPVAPGVRLGGDLGYYTARGLLLGPSGSYTNPADPDQLHGLFRSGYINDHGDKKFDVLGRPVPENRGFVEWEHQQLVTDRLSLTAELNWWKDSEVLRDFRPRLFFPVQQPDTFVEATYVSPNSFASVFARFEPNSFEIVQRRLPEIRFDVMPMAVGGGFYQRFNGSIAVLSEEPAPGMPSLMLVAGPIGGPMFPAAPVRSVAPDDTWTAISPLPNGAQTTLRSTRFDAYYSLIRPIANGDWLTVTPVVGGRFTHYDYTHGVVRSESYTRALGELGADAELHANGTFAYKNEAWHIDGLRHLFTPRLSYRYIPKADRGRMQIPPIDRQTFSTYLQPLGLGDVRNIDDLRATNTLRLSLDNTLQTRDPQTGPRDLLTLNVAEDFRFKRRPGERDVSEIHAELAAMPTHWLEFGLYSSFAPQTFTLREFNSGITIRDGRAWTLRFANNFLRHQLEDYLIDGRARINEQFDALAQLRYDQRKHRFTEQSYGIVHNLANTWRISYLVSLYSGRQRESGFGFSIQIDTVRF